MEIREAIKDVCDNMNDLNDKEITLLKESLDLSGNIMPGRKKAYYAVLEALKEKYNPYQLPNDPRYLHVKMPLEGKDKNIIVSVFNCPHKCGFVKIGQIQSISVKVQGPILGVDMTDDDIESMTKDVLEGVIKYAQNCGELKRFNND